MFRQTTRFTFFAATLLVLLLSFAACAPNMSPAQPANTNQEAAAPEATVKPAEQAADAAPATTNSGTRTFAIDSAQSKARFYIDELLRGNPKTVIGETSKVSGSITVDLGDVSKSSVGTIQIDASDLTTDSTMRNGAIRRFILQSSKAEYQYITFEPTALEGLPTSANVGDSLAFKVTGNLKIRDVVNPATFDITVTVNAENQLTGMAKTTITRTAYQLNIPSVPGVANVAEEVPLEFEFVAIGQ